MRAFYAALLFLAAAVAPAQEIFPPPSGSSGSTVPFVLQGPSLWLEADCITISSGACSVPADGTLLSTWADKSGRNVTLSIGGGSPNPAFHVNQINGYPAVTFNGSSYFAFDAAFPLNSSFGHQMTVFAIAKAGSTSTRGAIISGNSSGSFKYYIAYSSAEQGLEINSQYFEGKGTAAADLNWHKLCIAFSDTSATWSLNFQLDGATDATNTSGATQNAISQSLDTLGYGNGDPLQNGTQLAALVVFNYLLTSTEISQWSNYLYGKYGK